VSEESEEFARQRQDREEAERHLAAPAVNRRSMRSMGFKEEWEYEWK